MDEIPALLPVRVAAAAPEQVHLAVFQQLPVQLEYHAGHGPLVLLTGAVDVEIPQAGDL